MHLRHAAGERRLASAMGLAYGAPRNRRGGSMFFVISKVFWLLVQPLSLSFLFALVGVILLALGRRRLGISAATLGVLVLGLASFTNIGEVAIAPLENAFARPAELPAQVDAIVLLGGSTSARVSTARQVVEATEAGDRLVETLWLAQRYPTARIVLTGGSGALGVGEVDAEATTMQRFLLAFGISPERLVLEGASRNTDENAEYTRQLLGQSPGNVVLVTSAFHMPRSIGLFRKVGIEAIAWPTDYRSTGEGGWRIDAVEPVSNLETASVAMKEWIGLVVYHWTGRIAEILPAQVSN